MNNSTELKRSYYKTLPVAYEADIVVCGGGVSGVFAAVSAADSGKSVIIIEQFGSVGGSATNALVTPLMSSFIKDNPQCSYISFLLRDKLFKYNGAKDANASRFDPLILKIALEELCERSNIKVLYYTFISDVLKKDKKVESVIISNKKGLQRVNGKIFIDATGDGDISVFAGAKYAKGDPDTGKNQPVSLRYMISGVNHMVLGQFLLNEIKRTGINKACGFFDNMAHGAVCGTDGYTLGELFEKAIKNGDLIDDDKYHFAFCGLPSRPDTISFNNPEFFDKVDGTDPEHLTFTQTEGKKAIYRQYLFLKKYLPGFENSYISEVSPMVGIRESRRISAEYIITGKDYYAKQKFFDVISQTNYPVDIHGKKLNFRADEVVPADDGKPWYEIPFRSLVVREFDNLLVCGRCIGADFIAQSSLRIQPTCRSTGEAAGIGASFAIDKNIAIREIDGSLVRKEMVSRGAVFAD